MYNRNNFTLKPEYVLKRANGKCSYALWRAVLTGISSDLINSAVGSNAEKEKRIALEQLHTIICEKKKKGDWNKSFEQLMKKHLELCVDLKDHHTAKDGLHQYRNLCVATEAASLEAVILHLLDLSEARAALARQKANKVALAAAARVSDLDQGESPESIMLSSMTEDGSRERTDREVVVPWLKFLWEIYRATLDLLFRLPKLEKVYHKTCEKAFKFCLDYSRVMEFRRLSDAISSHLQNLQRPQTTGPTRTVKAIWEWTPEAIDMHLQTRVSQLEVATTLELWNEGFRTIEDINTIMAMGKRAPKAKLMTTYYDKLTKIFWVADNKLYHAYAVNKLFQWSCESKKEMKADEKAMLASTVLLAALTVLPTKDGEEEKPNQFSALLDFQNSPSRANLLQDVVAKGMLADALPEFAALYEALEVKFSPFLLVKTVSPIIDMVSQQPSLAQYAAPLQRIVILKLMQQLAKVYSTIKLETVYRLLGDLKVTPVMVERVVMEGISKGQLALKINHLTASITFTPSTPSEALDNQMSSLGSALARALHTIGSSDATARKAFLAQVAAAAEEDVSVMNERKALIELRKEGLEKVQQERAKEDKRIREIEEEKRIKEEEERLSAEENVRVQEKKRKAAEKTELLRIQKELEKYGIIMDEAALTELTVAARLQLIVDAQNKAISAKEEEVRRVQDQARKLDFITRALRIESTKAVLAKQEADKARDTALYAAKSAEIAVKWNEQHQQDLAEKTRLARMQAFRGKFEEGTLAKQRAAYEKRLLVFKRQRILEKRENNVDQARRLYDEECARIEEEREIVREKAAKEERDRLEREQHERLRRQREQEEEMEKTREADLERMRKQIADAENKAKYAPPLRAMAPAPTGPTILRKEPAEAAGGWGARPRGDAAAAGDDRRGPAARPPAPAGRDDRPEPSWDRRGGDRERDNRPAAGGGDSWGRGGAAGAPRDNRDNFRERERADPRESRGDARGESRPEQPKGEGKPEPWKPSRPAGGGGAPNNGPLPARRNMGAW